MTEWILIAAVILLAAMCLYLSDQVNKLRFAAVRERHLEIVVAALIEAQRADLRGERDAARVHSDKARNAYITLDGAGTV